jgi:hypothetical protein
VECRPPRVLDPGPRHRTTREPVISRAAEQRRGLGRDLVWRQQPPMPLALRAPAE